MTVSEIQVSQLPNYEGRKCPVCHHGTLRRHLDHDAMSGNRTVLKCSQKNPCTHQIEIVRNQP